MSEARNTFGKRALTQKSRKLPVRFDLTAMVSISFLLIIFFMLSSYMSRPQAMDLGMPEKRVVDDFSVGCCECGNDRSMTLLLGKNNEIISYYGLVSYPIEGPKKLNYTVNSLRKELFNKSKLILERYNDPRKGLTVIIKPSKESTYKNLVDVLDEMAIVGVKTYVVVDDITPQEKYIISEFDF